MVAKILVLKINKKEALDSICRDLRFWVLSASVRAISKTQALLNKLQSRR